MGGLWVAGFGVDVAGDHEPSADAVEVAEGRLETAEVAEGGEPRGALCLLKCHLAGYLAVRTGREPDDLAFRTLAGAVMGVTMAGMFTFDDEPTANIGVSLDEAVGYLEAGLAL